MTNPGGGPAPPVASIVIPAHNEAAVIERCLSAVRAGAGAAEFEVVVVANGCSDDTADRARRVADDIRVIELDVASKSAALNAGDHAASALPRVYLDADVVVDAGTIRAVAAALTEGGIHCAAPAIAVELSGRPWYVRSFFHVYLQLPYIAEDMVGQGFYALSEEGRRRFDRFPDITSDDLFIRNLFRSSERKAIAEHTFTIYPPRRLRGLLAIRQRTYRGNREYSEAGYASVADPTRDAGAFLSVARRHPLDFLVYAAVNLAAKLLADRRRHQKQWERDDSGRSC